MRTTVLTTFLVALSACSSAFSYQPTPSSDNMSFKAGGLGYPESFYVEQLDALKKRAAFDMDCDAESLTMTQMRPGSMASIGVAGCSAKAVYLWTGSEWVMNNASEGG